MSTMKALLLGSLLLIASLVPSHAAPFEAGKRVKLNGTILCDTEAQLDEILTAQEASFEAGKKVYQKWFHTSNSLNQRACMYVGAPRWIDAAPIKIVKTFVVYAPNGKQFPVHLVAVLWYDPTGTEHTGYVFSDKEIVQPASLEINL